MVTVPHIMVGFERMLDYIGVGLVRYHCTHVHTRSPIHTFGFMFSQFPEKVNAQNHKDGSCGQKCHCCHPETSSQGHNCTCVHRRHNDKQ